MADRITSLQNPKIKNIVRLSKANERRRQDLFVIEGCREISMALASGIEVRELYVAPEICVHAEAQALLARLPKACEVQEISASVFEKAAYRDNSDGLIALAVPRRLGLDDLRLGESPLLLVMESPEKPGNIGAILRSADAAALDAVILCDPVTDLYNPNAVRASLGCVFSCPVATCSSQEAIAWLHRCGIGIFPAALTAECPYYKADFTGSSAIVMGSEANGLTPAWLDCVGMPIKIPMGGRVDSLNLSTSAAVLMFEAKRQRDCRGAGTAF